MSTKKRKRIKVIISIIELILLITLLINRIQYTFIQFSECSQKINGRICSTETTISGNIKYCPVYKIEVDGNEYFHRRIFNSDSVTWKEGDVIEIRYNPSNPKQMYTLEEMKSHRSKGMVGIAGTILLGCMFFGVKLLK